MNGPTLPAGILAALIMASATGCDRFGQDMPQDRPGPAGDTNGSVQASPQMPVDPQLPERPGVVTLSSAIDWEAARRDFANRTDPEAPFAVQIASGSDAPAVPVFMPPLSVSAQSGDEAIIFQMTPDGYFVTLPGETFDVIVNGTNFVAGPEGIPRSDEIAGFRYEPTLTGALVAFSRYGADYLVEFECKTLPGGQAGCISEEEALAYARDLELAGTR